MKSLVLCRESTIQYSCLRKNSFLAIKYHVASLFLLHAKQLKSIQHADAFFGFSSSHISFKSLRSVWEEENQFFEYMTSKRLPPLLK